jgi:hypothetical protein
VVFVSVITFKKPPRHKKFARSGSICRIFTALCCSAALLVRFNRSRGYHVVKPFPADYSLGAREPFVTTVSFPESPQHADSIFASSFCNKYCHHWSFVHEGEPHAVAPRTRRTCSWRSRRDSNALAVATLSGTFRVPAALSCGAFAPCGCFGADVDLAHVWKAILTNRGVLIVGPSPKAVSRAVFALMALVAPFQCRDPVLVFTRFADVIDGSTVWKVVATTNVLAVERCPQPSGRWTTPIERRRSASRRGC